jgi:hypothetical protein
MDLGPIVRSAAPDPKTPNEFRFPARGAPPVVVAALTLGKTHHFK